MSQADIDATRAPLMEHLIELRSRLIKALIAFLVMFILCFFFAKNIYNLLVLPLAASGWLPPYLAAAGMSLSSLIVVSNSMRLNR